MKSQASYKRINTQSIDRMQERLQSIRRIVIAVLYSIPVVFLIAIAIA